MAPTNPQAVTVRGRLSFPRFKYSEAVAQNATSKFPKPPEDIRPTFDLLLEQAHADRLVTHLRDVFIPWCVERGKAKEKSGLTEAQAKKLIKILDEGDWEVDSILGLIKPVHEKTQALAPEAVMTVTAKGYKGSDIELKAVVHSTEELANPTDDLIIPERGLVLPVADTTHELYPGAVVGAQLDLFAFIGANVGITATAGVAIFLSDNERFGGGAAFDEDSFLDDLDD